MTRQIIYFILASLLVVIGAHYLAIPLLWIKTLHQTLLNLLGSIFAGGEIGMLLRKTLALLLLPPIVVAIPAFLYWMLQRRKTMPYIKEALWGLWLVSATILLLS
jgi:hypothetical protein